MALPSVAVVGDNTVDRFVGALGRDFVGGNAVNVAVQLAERGYPVEYFGVVGDDEAGEWIRAELVARRVGVGGLLTRRGATALTVIRVDDGGDRHMEEEHFGVTADYVPDGAQLELMARADWVQLGMVPQASEVRRALRAIRPDLPIGQDCSVADGYADLTVAFQSTAPTASAVTAAGALARGALYAVITLGEFGSECFGPDDVHIRQPALPVDVVDTTGAGDSFIAGFVSVFARTGDPAGAMVTGREWATRTCGHVGGFPQDAHPTTQRRRTGSLESDEEAAS
jgi:sugar/nucleoside kinase (ribokinase family)